MDQTSTVEEVTKRTGHRAPSTGHNPTLFSKNPWCPKPENRKNNRAFNLLNREGGLLLSGFDPRPSTMTYKQLTLLSKLENCTVRHAANLLNRGRGWFFPVN